LKETLSQYLVDRIHSASNVRVIKNSQVVALEGDELLRSITVENRETGERHARPPRAQHAESRHSGTRHACAI
jgi:thioredoxin reductase